MRKTSDVHHSHSRRAAPKRANAPRKAPKQERSQATVQAILKAASQVLVRVGYDRATTGLIADTAGVSVGSLYQYFPNKEALFSELLRCELDEALAAMMAAVASSSGGGAREQLGACIAALLRYKGANPRLHRVLKTELGRLDGHRLVRNLNERSLTLTAAILRAHQTELKLADPERAAFFLVNAVDGVICAALLQEPSQLVSAVFQKEVTNLAMATLAAVGGHAHRVLRAPV